MCPEHSIRFLGWLSSERDPGHPRPTGSWMQPVPRCCVPVGVGSPWDQGSGKAVMEQGILSLPGAACGPGQVIPSLFHAFSMAKLKTVS